MKIKSKLRLVALATLISATGVILSEKPSFAAVSNTSYGNQVVQKTLLNSLYKCYVNGGIVDYVEKLSSFSNFANQADNSTRVYLPTGLTPITNDDQSIGCKGLLAGDITGLGTEPGTFEGLFSLAGKSISASGREAKVALLTGMGYEDAGYTDDSAAVDNCITFTYNEYNTLANSTTEITTDNVCAALDSNGKIDHFTIDKSTATYAFANVTDTTFLPFFQTTSEGKIRFARGTVSATNHGYTQTTYKDTTKGVGDTWDDFVENIKQTAATEPTSFVYSWNVRGASGSYKYSLVGNSANGNTDQSNAGDSRYEFLKLERSDGFGTRAQKAAMSAVNYLSKNGPTYSRRADLSFSSDERLQYYLNVLMNYYYEGKLPSEYWKCNVTDWSNYSLNYDIDIKIDPSDITKQKDCKLNSALIYSGRRTMKWNGFYYENGDNSKWYFGTPSDFDQLIANINALASYLERDDTITDDPDVQNPDPGDSGENNPSGAASINDLCLSHNDAASVAWIVCPAVDGMAQGDDGIYGWIKGMLEVKTDLLASDSASYEIWSKFRDAANIIFIAVMLVVIISQVTGFGIDNYGIKKILPRLIITAALVNLSFILCQGAVDLSNIIGSSLSLWLSEIAVNTGPGVHTGVGFVSILETILAGGGAVAAGGASFGITIATIAGAAAGWWIILVVLAIVLLIALISILVVFLMLGARQLIVVAAVALAPLAIICYALPNTEKLFKRWLDIFKAALIMFPICSALAGMGQIIQAIVYGSNTELGMAVALIAAACPFLPFLVLPSLLKSSLKAVGDLGGKLSGLRNKAVGAGRSINSSLRNTDTYKDAQFQTAMRRNQTRLDKLMAKAKDGDVGTLSQGQQMRLNRYQRRAAAFAKEDTERKIFANGGFDATMASIDSAASKQEVENAATLWGRDHNGYNSDEMYSELFRLMNLADGQSLSAQDELTMKALMMKMSGGSGYDKKLMAKAISKGTNTNSIAAAAKYMTKNGDVASAISKKDAATAQYLRELNGGGINTRGANGGIVSFSDWYKTERKDNDGNLMGATNARFVMSEVTTENADFVGQSSSVVARSLGLKEVRDASGETQYVHDDSISPDLAMDSTRIENIVNDQLLMNSADNNVRKALMAAARFHGISVPASSNTAPIPVTNPAPTVATPSDPTQLDIQHPAPQVQPVQTPQPQPQQSVRDRILNVQPGELERLKAEADKKMNGGRGPNNGQGPIIFT